VETRTIPGPASFKLDMKVLTKVMETVISVLLRYYGKGTDIGADGEPL